jgi:hypothetical protein
MTTKSKPKIDAVTLNLVNKLKQIDDTINEGAWEYIHLGDIIRLQDAFHTIINHYAKTLGTYHLHYVLVLHLVSLDHSD